MVPGVRKDRCGRRDRLYPSVDVPEVAPDALDDGRWGAEGVELCQHIPRRNRLVLQGAAEDFQGRHGIGRRRDGAVRGGREVSSGAAGGLGRQADALSEAVERGGVGASLEECMGELIRHANDALRNWTPSTRAG